MPDSFPSIIMIWEKISPSMRFQQKCPDFRIQMSGILDPRIPPFRRSVFLANCTFTKIYPSMCPCLWPNVRCSPYDLNATIIGKITAGCNSLETRFTTVAPNPALPFFAINCKMVFAAKHGILHRNAQKCKEVHITFVA